MRLAVFLTGIIVITLLSWVCFFCLLFYFDPLGINKIILILVYLTLFLGLAGFLTLVGIGLRKILGKSNLAFKDATASFGQGIFLAFVLVGILILRIIIA